MCWASAVAQTVPDASPYVFAIVTSGDVSDLSQRARTGCRGIPGAQGPTDWRHADALHRSGRHSRLVRAAQGSRAGRHAAREEVVRRHRVRVPRSRRLHHHLRAAGIVVSGYSVPAWHVWPRLSSCCVAAACARRQSDTGGRRTCTGGDSSCRRPVLSAAAHALGRSRPAGQVSGTNEYETPLGARPVRGRWPRTSRSAEMALVRESAEQQAVDAIRRAVRAGPTTGGSRISSCRTATPWSLVDPPTAAFRR